MTLLTVQQYRDITRDIETNEEQIEAGLVDATSLLEEYLGRTLEYGTYTERLKVWPRGFAYPSAVPLASVSASSSAEIYDEASLWGVEPDDRPFTGFLYLDSDYYRADPMVGLNGSGYETNYPYATITYTGGFTAGTLPYKLKRAIAVLTQAITSPPSDEFAAMRVGATLLRVGDVQVGYPREAVLNSGLLDEIAPGLSNSLRGYRLRRE